MNISIKIPTIKQWDRHFKASSSSVLNFDQKQTRFWVISNENMRYFGNNEY